MPVASSDTSDKVPAAMRNASMASTSRVRAFPKQRDRGTRKGATGRERGTKSIELGRRRQFAVPQQPGRLLERGVLGQLVDREPGNHQLTAFAVDMTQLGLRRDHAVQAALTMNPA